MKKMMKEDERLVQLLNEVNSKKRNGATEFRSLRKAVDKS
jgi:hypothetical protein